MRRAAHSLWWLGSAAAYAALCWLLAANLLAGPLEGSDWPNTLAFADWMSRSFPAIPFWFPYQGGGVSPSAGYAIAPIYLIAGLHVAGVDLVVAGRVVAFGAMVVGALGVAALARALGLGRGWAFAAGAFSLLPPAAWNLLIYVGFYANTIAAALLPWSIAALVAYARYERPRLDRRGVALFAACVLLLAATFVAHPAVAPAGLILGAITAATVSRRGPARVLAVGIPALLCVSGALVAFVVYNRAANAGGVNDLSPAIVAGQNIPPSVLLGLSQKVQSSGLLESMSLTPFLLALAILAVPFAVRDPRWRGLLVTTAFAIAYLFSVDFEIALATANPLLSPLLGFRGILIFAIVGLAVLGAAALSSLARLGPSRVAAPAVAAVAVVGLVFLEIPGYGPHHEIDPTFLRARLPTMLARGHMIVEEGRTLPSGISSEFMWDDKLPLASQHFSGEAGRVDVSPLLGSLLKALPLRSDARTMNLYTFTLSLLHLSWSDEQQALFLDNAYGVAGASVSEMSAWFGVDRVAQRGNAPPDPPEDPSRFSAAGWAVTSEGRLYLAASPRTHTLAAFRERGIVLHIGETKNEAYRNTYRLASAGALPFADGWLVQGPACVDDISPAELARFDVVILEDQCMRDVLADEAKLDAYVERGGRLFVETGWEFSPLAKTASTPDFLPAADLRWQAPSGTLAFGDAGVDVRGLDLARFGDFRYESGAWNVSAPDSPLRQWARPVLLAGGRPLIAAGQLGQGRVVWSGVNLVTHVRAKQSVDERELYHRIMRWLLDGASTATQELDVSALDEDGGTVRLPADGWLLWRESPIFASVAPDSGTRYSAGPGLLLARLAAGSVRIEQHPSPAMRLAAFAGALATAVLLLWAALGLGAGGAGDPAAIFGAIGRAAVRAVPRFGLDEDE